MPEETQNEEKTFTQAELDEIVQKRIAKERSKYADYDEIKAKLAEIEAKPDGSEDLAAAVKRAEEAEAKLAGIESAKQRDALLKKVMEENHVDAKYAPLLTATDEAELTEQAKLLADKFAESVSSDTGKQPNVTPKDDAARKFAHELFGGGNPNQ